MDEEFFNLDWKLWLKRPFGAFMVSFFLEAGNKENSSRFGFDGCIVPAQLFQKAAWYESEKIWSRYEERAEKILEKKSIFDISKDFDDFVLESERMIEELKASDISSTQKLKVIYTILNQCSTYIWFTHAAEKVYERKVEGMDPDMVSRFSKPEKKNMQGMMEEEILAGKSSEDISRKYGFLKSRDGFSDPYSSEEIDDIRKHIVKKDERKVVLPEDIKDIFLEIRELVYFRTHRTDMFYKLIFISRPIFRDVANHYGLGFQELKDYSVPSLIYGKIKKYNDVSFATFEGEFEIRQGSFFEDEESSADDVTKGRTAFLGKVTGKVKVVKSIDEISKVEKGDILITHMTTPSFIAGMHKAAAFVTDEGSLTCHAAIVAREMKKPCIIGTKNGTKVFKDGDMVEVDADKGEVRKIG